MPRTRSIRKSPSRVLLSDVLPYETSPIFSNRGFYSLAVLTKLQVSTRGIIAERMSELTNPLVSIILGQLVSHGSSAFEPLIETGTGKAVSATQPTIPFRFTVRHKRNEYRTLTVPHPRAQLEIAAFYEQNSSLMLHYSSISSFSLRHVSRVARYTVTKDWLFEQLRGGNDSIEELGAEYDWIRSYFTYSRYSNIYKFYDSSEYRSAERRFGYLVRVDIAKCFDSIYTHSIAWATHGHDPIKSNISSNSESIANSFGDNFDRLMQRLNHNETSGITIGSETSRIFAEIILQRIDRFIEDELSVEGLRFGTDYEILRYVDDYFVFVANQENELSITETISRHLRKYKLHLNAAKEEGGVTPWLSPLTVAKQRVRDMLRTGLRINGDDLDAGKLPRYYASDRSLAIDYKAVLIDTQVGHLEIANYALSQVEMSIERLVRNSLEHLGQNGSSSSSERVAHLNSATATSLSLIDLAFLIFSGAPRLSPAIKVARICALVVEYVRKDEVPTYLREQVLLRVHVELLQQLRRARSAASPDSVTATLLDCVTNLGSDLRIGEDELSDMFGFKSSQGSLVPTKGMNANLLFSLLAHLGDAPGYLQLRGAAEAWIRSLQRRPPIDGERALVSANVVLCPFVSHETRLFVMQSYGYDSPSITNDLVNSQLVMNIDWRSFDLYRALHKKRLYDVY